MIIQQRKELLNKSKNNINISMIKKSFFSSFNHDLIELDVNSAEQLFEKYVEFMGLDIEQFANETAKKDKMRRMFKKVRFSLYKSLMKTNLICGLVF